MGTILSSRIMEDGKVIYEVVLDTEESLQLKGQMNEVHLFSEANMNTHSRLSKRGKNDATMYLLVPKELRADLKKEFKSSINATCQIIKTNSKRIFIFSIDEQ